MYASGAAKLALFTHKQLIQPKPSLKTRGEDGYDHRIICFCVSDIGLVIPTVENPHPQQQHEHKTELHKEREREGECKSLQNKTFLWNFNDNLDIYFGMAQQGNTLLRQREKRQKKASKWHGKLLLFHKIILRTGRRNHPLWEVDQNLSPPKERNARPLKLRASARLRGWEQWKIWPSLREERPAKTCNTKP